MANIPEVEIWLDQFDRVARQWKPHRRTKNKSNIWEVIFSTPQNKRNMANMTSKIMLPLNRNWKAVHLHIDHLTIIPQARVGYEMVDSQRGA